MTQAAETLIDRLSGIIPGSSLDLALAARGEARRHAQTSHDLLLHPSEPGPVSLLERHAIAAFVAVLHQESENMAHFARLLEDSDPSGGVLARTVLTEAERASAPGPYGRFPAGPLSAEDLDGPNYIAGPQVRAVLGDRLAAALEHMVALHPRDGSSAALQRLQDAGWTTPGIVTLTQLVGFLSYQIRVVAGLRAVAASKRIRPAAVPA